MTLPVYSRGTRGSTSFPPGVTINSSGWTQLWAADPNRSFASVLGGTGTPGEIIYLTANPSALITDPDVAQSSAARGPLLVETRGTNALYARINAGSLLVRTTLTTQVAKVPVPAGTIGAKDYKVLTDCGGGAITYIGGLSDLGGSYAPVIGRDDARIRTTFLGDDDNVMLISTFEAAKIIPLISTGSFTSSGPFYPGPLVAEGVEQLSLLDFGGVGPQEHVYWVRDKKVAL